MRLIDASHPFYRPLWRRVAVVAVCVVWAAFEFLWGGPFWGVLAASLGAYAAWELFIADPPRPPQDGRKEP